MQSFKQYISKIKQAIVPKKPDNQPPVIPCDIPSYEELRSNDKKINEAINPEKYHNTKCPVDHYEDDLFPHDLGARQVSGIIKPFAEAKSTVNAGYRSSENMKAFTRNIHGDKSAVALRHMPEKVHEAQENFTGLFLHDDKRITNRSHLEAYSGAPAKFGRHLMENGPEKKHMLPCNMSLSLHRTTPRNDGDDDFGKRVAVGFGAKMSKRTSGYNNPDNGVLHLIHAKCEPKSVLSVAPFSKYPENEVATCHGRHITYHGTTEEPPQYGVDHFHGVKKILVHHITVHGGADNVTRLHHVDGVYEHMGANMFYDHKTKKIGQLKVYDEKSGTFHDNPELKK